MRWLLSDGTVVHLGGKVEGDSRLALILRHEVEDAKQGYGPEVALDAQPCEGTPVDMENVVHVHYWVTDTARCLGVEVLSSPDLPVSKREPLTKPDPATYVN